MNTSFEQIDEMSASRNSICTSNASSVKDAHVDLLVGCDNDPLIPTSEAINSTFHKGQTLWRTYLANAEMLPSGCLPYESLYAYNVIQDVPPLPQDLYKKQTIMGRALWQVPSPEFHPSDRIWKHDKDEMWNPELIQGVEKSFPLSTERPTRCKMSTLSQFDHITSTEQSPESAPNGIAILILMWSYILSARLLEMQKRRMRYSFTTLLPVLPHDIKHQSGDIVVHTGSASKSLLRWMCAILVQRPGFTFETPLPTLGRIL